MRLSEYTDVVVNGYGVLFSMCAKRFNNEVCKVTWVDHESDDQWIKVKDYEGLEFTVHAIQCTPLPDRSYYERR